MREDIDKQLQAPDDNTDPFVFTDLSEEEIREYTKYLDKDTWGSISCYQTLSIDFIREFKKKLEWGPISAHQELNEDFIIEFKDYVNWVYICQFQTITEKVLDRCFEYIPSWSEVAKYQKLNEEIIEKYWKFFGKNSSAVEYLLNKYTFSEKFLKKHKKDICNSSNISNVLKCQKISSKFRKELLRREKRMLLKFIVVQV